MKKTVNSACYFNREWQICGARQGAEVFDSIWFLMQYRPPQAFPDLLFPCLLLSKNYDIGLKKESENFTDRAMSWRAPCFGVGAWSEAVCLKRMWRVGDRHLAFHPSPCENVSLAGTGEDGPSVLGPPLSAAKSRWWPAACAACWGPTRGCALQALPSLFTQLHASFLPALALRFRRPQVRLTVMNPMSY